MGLYAYFVSVCWLQNFISDKNVVTVVFWQIVYLFVGYKTISYKNDVKLQKKINFVFASINSIVSMPSFQVNVFVSQNYHADMLYFMGFENGRIYIAFYQFALQVTKPYQIKIFVNLYSKNVVNFIFDSNISIVSRPSFRVIHTGIHTGVCVCGGG